MVASLAGQANAEEQSFAFPVVSRTVSGQRARDVLFAHRPILSSAVATNSPTGGNNCRSNRQISKGQSVGRMCAVTFVSRVICYNRRITRFSTLTFSSELDTVNSIRAHRSPRNSFRWRRRQLMHVYIMSECWYIEFAAILRAPIEGLQPIVSPNFVTRLTLLGRRRAFLI